MLHHSSWFIIIDHHSLSCIIYVRTYVRTYHYSSSFILMHHPSFSSSLIMHHPSLRTYVRTYVFIIIHHASFIIIHHHSFTYVRTYVSFITIPHHPSLIIMPSLFTMMHHHYSSPSIIHHLPSSSSSFITIHCALCTPRLSLLCCGAPLPMVFKGCLLYTSDAADDTPV